jgi:hypothetical protein
LGAEELGAPDNAGAGGGFREGVGRDDCESGFDFFEFFSSFDLLSDFLFS